MSRAGEVGDGLRLRRERASLRERVASGGLSLSELFDMDSMAARGMRVDYALRSVVGIGPARAASIMETARVAEGRRVGGLGRRQREAILNILEGVSR